MTREDQHIDPDRVTTEDADAPQAAVSQGNAQSEEPPQVAATDRGADRLTTEQQWLVAERAEATRISTERTAAQAAEETRLAPLILIAGSLDDPRVASHPPLLDAAAARYDPDPSTRRGPQLEGSATGGVSRAAVEPAPFPAFVRFEPDNPAKYFIGTGFIAAVAAAVVGAVWSIGEGSVAALTLAAAAAIAAVFSWRVLLRSTPDQVSIRNGFLDISAGDSVESFDLRDPATPITVTGDTDSRGWQATVNTVGGPVITLTRREVDPAQFAELVARYRALGPRTHQEN